MRKKINLLRLTATFIIMLVLSLVLIACGGGTQNNEADVQSVLQAKEALSIGFIGNDNEDHVIYDVSLIESGIMGVSITWESSDADVISVAGVVTRPSVDTTVTLTATLTKGDAFDTKQFDLVVIGTAEDDLLAALETLVILFAQGENRNNVRSDLELTTELDGDILVAWASSSPSVISEDGSVYRADENVVVTLTATLSKGGFNEVKTFEVTVIGLNADIVYYSVEFVNTDLDTLEVVHGSLVEEPVDFEIEDKMFLGWFTDQTYQTEFDFSQPITQNTLIYAHVLDGIEATIPEILAIGADLEHQVTTTQWYIVSGKVKSISNAQYGNMVITDGEHDLPVYGVWGLGGTTRFDELSDKPFVGDIVYLFAPIQRFFETIELNNSQLIKFHEDENEPPFDINDYEPVDIADARSRDEDAKVLITGVVAQINHSNGFIPTGAYIVDDTGSIYVYDLVVAGSVSIGDEVVIAGVRANFVLETETYWADRHGYEGAIQLTGARLIEKLGTDLEFNKDWIEEISIKDIMETDHTVENITGSIHKVTAIINKVPGTGFINYYFNDLDNKTGSYVYTMNNGNDFNWLDQYDGQLRVVYLSVINARSNAAGVLYRFLPIAVGELVEYDDSYNAEYAVVYEGRGQLDSVYYEGYSPNKEVTTLVNNTYLNIENVPLTYTSSNEAVGFFEEVEGKLIFKTGVLGTTTVRISSTYGEITYYEEFEITVTDLSDLETLTVAEAINSVEEDIVTVRGIVAASLVNQSGFFLIDETGLIAVRMVGSELDQVSIGNEVVVRGIKTHVRGSNDPSVSLGQLVIDEAIVYINLQGDYDYPTDSFLGTTTLAYLSGLDRLEEHSTSVWTVEATIRYVATPYYTRYDLQEGTETYSVYSSSGSQLSFLDPYRDQTVEIEITVVNWNGNRYALAIIAIIVDGVRIPSNQNFRN